MPPRESSDESAPANEARPPRPRLSVDGIIGQPARRDFTRPVVPRRPAGAAYSPRPITVNTSEPEAANTEAPAATPDLPSEPVSTTPESVPQSAASEGGAVFEMVEPKKAQEQNRITPLQESNPSDESAAADSAASHDAALTDQTENSIAPSLGDAVGADPEPTVEDKETELAISAAAPEAHPEPVAIKTDPAHSPEPQSAAVLPEVHADADEQPLPTVPADTPNTPASPAVQPSVTPPASTEPTPQRDFTPPPKPRRKVRLPRLKPGRRLLRFTGVVLVVLILAAAAAGAYMWYAARNNPDTIFKKALTSSLTVSQLKTVETGGDPVTAQEVSHDFSAAKNPLASSQATIKLSGANFDIATYGSLKNTYFSYRDLPTAVPTTFRSVTPGSWVQLRADGTMPAGVSAGLAQAADPIYLNFGPVVLGNFSAETRQQLLDYAAKNRIYPYNPKTVQKQAVDGKQVLIYSMKLNVGYLKLLNQSAAGNQGASPETLLVAASSLDSYKDATVKLYVDKGSQRFVRADITKDGQTRTILYRAYNQVTMPNEPQTKLQWTAFAPFQYQMEALAVNGQPLADRDKARQAALGKLHDALAVYFTDNNSYPMLAELNSQSWVATNLRGVDPALFRDPQGQNLQLASAPKASTYAYQALSADGKNLCDGSAANPCVHYRLTTTLSTNQPYVVQDP